LRASVAVGVGKLSRSALRTARPSSLPLGPGFRRCPGFGIPCGVGHDPDPLSQVRCPELSSRQARPLRVIPCFGQVSENSSDRASVPALPLTGEEGGHVLHDDVSGSKLANDPGELRPKTRAGAVEPGAFAGAAEVLTGEPAADEIDGVELAGSDLSHVLEPGGVGEVLGEDGSAVGVLLDLPGDAHPGALEAELEPADAGEEASDIHAPPLDLAVALKTGT
jgi:hypothetical protein